MSSRQITLDLPEAAFRRLQERALQTGRSVEEEAREVLASAVGEQDTLPADLDAAIAPMTLLSDAELWQACRTRLPQAAVEQLEALHFKRQREGLTEAEAATTAVLVHQYERVMLSRAQAAALLKQRGHDVSGLLPDWLDEWAADESGYEDEAWPELRSALLGGADA
jgi:plasmid stability protein